MPKPAKKLAKKPAPQGERTGRQVVARTNPLFIPASGISTLTSPLTGQQIVTLTPEAGSCGAVGLSTFAAVAGYPGAWPSTYATYREMSRDPTFALAIAAANSPIMAAEWGYEADEGVAEDRFEWLNGAMEKWRPHVVKECLRAREFGWRGMEKVFWLNPKSSYLEYRKLKALLPERTAILIFKETGEFAGFRQDNVALELDRCFLYTFNQDCDDYYGNPLHNNGLRAWANWLATIDNGYRLQKKISGTIIQLHYPVGKSKDKDGVEKDNSEHAQTILNNVAAGKSVAMPNLFYTVNNNPETAAAMAGKSMWVLSAINVGDAGASSQALFDGSQKYWDVQKLRAWLVPERAATEGQFGTKAEAEAHADIILSVAEQEHGNIVREVNRQLVNPLLVYNFGEGQEDTIRIKPEPIVDEKRALLKELFTNLIADPGRFEGLLSGEHGDPPDFDAIMDQLGLPRTPVTEDIVRGIVTQAQANVNGEDMPQAIQDRIAGDYQQAHSDIEGPPSAQRDTGVAVDQALNGAQITAAIDLMSQLRLGTIVKEVAVELLVAVGLPRERADRMVRLTLAAPALVESNGNGQPSN